jgi:phosphoribosyl 1,2-cyclic phosphate phosphodiesterase
VRLTLLGTGTSMGVPQIGCDCPVCRSDDPRDQRSRTAALVETDESTILIDTPPELRMQLLAAGKSDIDAVLYTHLHADHVHGIDDLRSVSLKRGEELGLYGPAETVDHLRKSFNYIFDDSVVPLRGTSKPSLALNTISAGKESVVAGTSVLPLEFMHGKITVFGYRIGPLAYLTDVKDVDDAAVEALNGVEVLVISALWWRQHPTHLSIEEAIDVARRVGAERTLLTHLTHETSHRELLRKLPPGIEPGYDGQTIKLTPRGTSF